VKDAWYIVDVYCFLCLYGVYVAIRKSHGQFMLLSITVAIAIAIFLLAWRTYRGSRIASRLLAVYIVFNAGSNILTTVRQLQSIEVYDVYMLGVYAYFVIGSVKLWRIKELPTRFTDLPTEEQAHN